MASAGHVVNLVVNKPMDMARSIILFILALAMAGCIKDDLSDCPPVVQALYLRTINANGLPVRDFEQVDEVTLFVFDENGKFMKTLHVGHDELDDRIMVPLEGYTGSKIYVSAWGNIGDGSVDIADIYAGNAMDMQFLALAEGGEGWYNPPGDIFFGFREIDLSAYSMLDDPGDHVEFVDVERMGATLSVTVAGIPEDADPDDYYFVLEGQNGGYDFQGNPVQNDCEIRVPAARDGDNFVARQPLHLIPQTEGMSLRLYRKAEEPGGEDTDLTGPITEDVNGDPITLVAGKTTNVLINLAPTGGLEVTVVITEWGHIYQWDEW
jgi:hypothetical protein